MSTHALFNFKGIADSKERTLGFMLRVLGIDISFLLAGWVSEWRVVDLRIPVNYGVYLQVSFLIVSIGRLDDSVYQDNV